MTLTADLQDLENAHVQGTDGTFGKVRDVFVDDSTDEPHFVGIRTGMFGSHEPLVPIVDATFDDGVLRVPYDKDSLKQAPRYKSDGQMLSLDEQDAIWTHYDKATGTTTASPISEPSAGADPSGEMTRSEEQLHVGTEKVESGRARLRKVVVTEEVTTTVPVSHEEVRLISEPIVDGEVVGEIGEQEQSVTLHAERPVVAKETVAVERVRLDTQTVTEQQEIDSSLRKEQIETEGV